MKVAFVVGQFPALSETFVLDQVTGLIDRGVDVDIYAGQQRPQPVLHADVERYGLVERTVYSRPPPERTGTRRAGVFRLIVGALARSGGSRLRVRGTFRHGRCDANTALGFAHAFREGRRAYDVIHCHFGPHGQWGMAMRNMGFMSGRLVTTFHGYDVSRYLRDEGEDVYRRLFDEGDFFLPISRFWRERLIELGCEPHKIGVHRMGVDCSNFAFCPRTLPGDGRFRVLTVGRLTEKKGVEYAIRAVAAFSRRHPGVEHTIIGDGPLRPSIEALIRELGAEGRIRLVGGKARDQVSRAMNAAHVLLAPSVTAADGNQEGIPVVLMEAMASGLPVISSHHTGIPELVEDGVSGFLVPERDVHGLTEALHRLLESPHEYARIAISARERVEASFDAERLNGRLFDTFRMLSEDVEEARSP